MKILVADDDFISRKMLDATLTNLGFETVIVEDGLQAFEYLDNNDDIQIAILDWIMPGLTGVEVCSKIRKDRKKRTPLYLILLTSMNSSSDIVTGLDSGADDYVIKPFNKRELEARINVGLRIVNLQTKNLEYSRDMERLANERAKQLAHADRMATIGMLTAGVAHEINNPTTFISISAQTIEENWDDFINSVDLPKESVYFAGEMPAMINDIKLGVNRIKDIVMGLKTYSRIESKEKKRISLKKIINQSINFTKTRYKEIELISDIPEGLPEIEVNETQIEQVFVNLLVNAADALNEIEEGLKKQVKIKTELLENHILISFENNGPPISKKKMASIFKPFYTTKEVGKGTGLGLSICKSILEDHRATIDVESSELIGVVFFIKLPFYIGE